VRPRRKSKDRRRARAADFDVAGGVGPDRNARVRKVGNPEQHFALNIVEIGDAFVAFLDLFRHALHFAEDRVGVLLFFLEARNFVARFVASGFQLFSLRDEFAAFAVEGAERVEVERNVAVPGHPGKEFEVIAEVAEIVHRIYRIADCGTPFSRCRRRGIFRESPCRSSSPYVGTGFWYWPE
jgi:hypothetical protein